MKETLRRYSGVLQLRIGAIQGSLDDFDAVLGLKLFVVVGLIAGLGVLMGIPHALRQLTLPEQIDQAASTARTTLAEVAAVVMPALVDAQSATEAVTTAIQGQVAAATAQVSTLVESVTGSITAGLDAGSEQVAQVQEDPRVQELLAQSSVTAAQVEEVIRQAPATAEQINTLLARANVSPEQATALLGRAGISSTQVQQVLQLRTEAGAAVDSAMAELAPMLAQMNVTEEQFRAILAQLSTTPEQINNMMQQLSVAPEALGQLVARLEATPAQLEQLAADLRTEAVKAEPPIGTRASRVVELFGNWLSVPLQIASDWMLFALVLLVVSKLLGGSAPLPKHLAAVALASAPLVLLLGTYIPDMSSVLSIPLSGAILYFSRILAIVGLVWAALLLLRTVSVAHKMSLWRTAGALALTVVAIYVLVPFAGLLVSGYFVAG
jgi:hypothetical protein